MDDLRTTSETVNHRSGNGPLARSPSSSPRRPLLPLYADSDRRRYRGSRRHWDLGQMMMNHRGSLLSTASLALIGATRRPSKTLPDFLEQAKSKRDKLSSWSKTKRITQKIYEKSRLKHFLPLLILLGYSFLGGGVIYWIEAPVERTEIEGKQKFLNDQRELLIEKVWDIRSNRYAKRPSLMSLSEAVHWYTVTTMYMDGNLTRLPPPASEVMSRVGVLRKYTDEMARRCWEIRLESQNRSDARRKIEDSLKLFELFTGVTTEVKAVWTFSNALFLAITIYTTIGYGSVAPHTVAGRIATIIYAIIGIPIYLMILHKLGRVFLKLLQKFWTTALRFASYLNCVKTQNSDLKMTKMNENENNIPVSLAVGVTFVWMLTCAGVCCLFFETSWDYFTSFYFFFISLTTIGFGDVTPTHPEYMFTMFGLIIVGLSLVSMCINVVQLKLELLFEEMMLALMEEYEKSGQLIDSDMIMESAFMQRGMGFVQMMKLWTRRKRDAEEFGDIFGGLFLPLTSRKRRGAFLRELSRRRRARTAATQTELWRTVSDDQLHNFRYDTPPWMMSTFERRQLRKTIALHTATQTDWSDVALFALATPSEPNWSIRPTLNQSYFPGNPHRESTARSQSSSMVTCDDNNSVFVNSILATSEPHMEGIPKIHFDDDDDDDDDVYTEDNSRILAPASYISDNEDGNSADSKLSPDLLSFIPYIEQEVPLEQEQGPLRRWSAAEAMSVFANWAATKGLGQPVSRPSRTSSDGDDYGDELKLARFQNKRKISGRRMTVAAGVQPQPPASKLRHRDLDSAVGRAAVVQAAISNLRLQSNQPSTNDLKAMFNEDRQTPSGPRLTVARSPTPMKYSEKSSLRV